MSLLDSILGAVAGKTDASSGTNPLIGTLGTFLAQNGGLQGLAAKFSQQGQGGTFASWVSTGENQAISADQIQRVLGSEQVSAVAEKLGIDPAEASHLLSEYLPKVVDKLTPNGKIEPATDHPQGLGALLPSLLQGLMGSPPPAKPDPS